MFDLDVASIDPQADEAALIARIADLERLKAAAAAGQARAAAALDAQRRTAEAEAGVPASKRGRGVASEVALARRDSPARGNRHLGFAKALVYEMPHTLAALETGVLSEWRATLIVRNRRASMSSIGARWTPNCAPTPHRWRVSATRGLPLPPRPSPTVSIRKPWWIRRRTQRVIAE